MSTAMRAAQDSTIRAKQQPSQHQPIVEHVSVPSAGVLPHGSTLPGRVCIVIVSEGSAKRSCLRHLFFTPYSYVFHPQVDRGSDEFRADIQCRYFHALPFQAYAEIFAVCKMEVHILVRVNVQQIAKSPQTPVDNLYVFR